jgi:hypothetical protein
MYQFIFSLVVLIFLVTIRLLGKRWLFGYVTGGLLFGIFNEFCFEFCWNYSPLLCPMLWRDVPLFVVLGWGLVSGLALTLSDRTMLLLHRTKLLHRMVIDVMFFLLLGYCVETSMSAMHFWEYNNPLLAARWAQIMGYIFTGVMVSCTGRMFQRVFDGGTSVKKQIFKNS